MMNIKYEVVKYSPEFKSQVLELQTHLWSPDVSLNAAYLEWKYERNPYLETPLIYMALCEGKVVGMRGMYGAKWQVGDSPQTLDVPCTGDLVIAPDHRDRGLFTKIMGAAMNDLANTGYTYTFNLSAGRITYLGSLAMGWRSTGPLQTVYRRSVSRGEPRYESKRLFLFSAEKEHPFHSLDRDGARCQVEVNPYVRVEQIPRPWAMAGLVERIGGDGRFRHVRDQKYFAWRFQNPLSLYRFLFWEDAGLEGYLVLQTLAYTDRARVSIVDWEATNMRVRTDLLRAAVRLGDFAYLTIWSPTLPDEAKMLLRNTGFNYLEEARGIEASSHHAVLVRPVRNDVLKTDWTIADRGLLDLANWDLRMIYSDGY